MYTSVVNGGIVVLMMKGCCELTEDLPNLPCPNYHYRISVPG